MHQPQTADPSEERPGVRRRAIVSGAAWAAPAAVVTTIAPAYAGSPCLPQTINWRQLSTAYGVTTIPVNGWATATMGKTTVTYSASGQTTAAGNSSVPQDVLTGGESSALRLTLPGTALATQTVTFDFSPAVASVELKVLDVDHDGNTYDDRVAVTPRESLSITRAGKVSGDGTAQTPFQSPSLSGGVPGSSPDANVSLRWSGSISRITLTYSQGPTVSASMIPFIGISNVTFTPSSC